MNNKTRFSLNGLWMTTIVLLSIIFLITSVQAIETDIGLKKAGDCVELVQTCSNCTSNNISSIILPNGTSTTYAAAVMTRTDTYYNYTYCNTSATGKYIVNGWGDLDGVDTVWSYTFITTHNGRSDIFNMYFIISMVALSIILLIFGVTTSNEYVGFLSGLLFMSSGVYLMIYGYSSITDIYTRAIAFILIGIGALVGIAAGYNVIEKMGSGEE